MTISKKTLKRITRTVQSKIRPTGIQTISKKSALKENVSSSSSYKRIAFRARDHRTKNQDPSQLRTIFRATWVDKHSNLTRTSATATPLLIRGIRDQERTHWTTRSKVLQCWINRRCFRHSKKKIARQSKQDGLQPRRLTIIKAQVSSQACNSRSSKKIRIIPSTKLQAI